MTADHRDFPILVAMRDYWHRKRGQRPMPRHADIDPVEIPKLLPYLRLTEVVEGGQRFRYRLVGTAVVEGHRVDCTGGYADEILRGDSLAKVERDYRTICRKGAC